MKVFLDSNIFLHGSPVGQLPFGALGINDPEILIHHGVLEEIDRKKYDNTQIGKKARRAISRLKGYLDAGPLPEGIVSIADTYEGHEFDWSKFPQLDKSKTDHHLLASLILRSSPGEQATLITSDYPLSRLGRRLDLDVKYVDAAPWINSEQLSAAEQELNRLRKQSPRLEFQVTDRAVGSLITEPINLSVPSVFPLSDGEIQALMVEARKVVDKRSGPLNMAAMESFGIIDRFSTPAFVKRNKDYPKMIVDHFKAVTFKARLMGPLVPFNVRLLSSGGAPVRGVELIIKCAEGLLLSDHDVDRFVSEKVIKFPQPPKPERPTDPYAAILQPFAVPDLGNISPRHVVGWHVYEDLAENAHKEEEIRCDVFKHGTSWSRDYTWHPWNSGEGTQKIDIVILTENIPDPIEFSIFVNVVVNSEKQSFNEFLEDELGVAGYDEASRVFWESALKNV